MARAPRAGPARVPDIVQSEALWRLSAFFGVFVVIALGECAAPRRVLALPRRARWPGNLGMVALNTVLVRALVPTALVGVALTAQAHGQGGLNIVTWPVWVEILVAVIVLDLVLYLQHVLFHAVPVLWRLHRMHHADVDFDVTTGVRFHPLEIGVSLAIKAAAVALLGASAAAVIVFEVLLSATSLFNHGNLRLPVRLDAWLRLVVVTPDMHRVHHSSQPRETNSNFGFNLPVWDRVLGTYRAQPEAGHAEMEIGLDTFREAGDSRLDRLLAQPFRAPDRRYAINRR